MSNEWIPIKHNWNDDTVIDVYIPVQDFSSALRAMMAVRNVNMVELAEQIEVSATSVYNWRIGKRFPNKMNIEKLCNALLIDDNIMELLIEQQKSCDTTTSNQ